MILTYVDIVLVVDVANVVGSRPDGWWRDRRGAAERLLALVAALSGRSLDLPDGRAATCAGVVAVVEGQARRAQGPSEVTVRRVLGEGDSEVVAAAEDALRRGDAVLVVTADRGLRERLPAEALQAGPNWLNDVLGR